MLKADRKRYEMC